MKRGSCRGGGIPDVREAVCLTVQDLYKNNKNEYSKGNMETKVLNYRILITPEKHEGRTVYNAYSPTLGVADWGETIEQAKHHIKGAIECHVEGLIEDNQPIPTPDEPDVMIVTTSITLPRKVKLSFV